MAEQEFQRTSEEESSHLLDYARLIWSRKWLVLLVAVSVFGISAYRARRTQPLYEAVVTVQLGVGAQSKSAVPILQLIETTAMETEIEILKSRAVAEKVVERLQKHYTINAVPQDVRLKVSGVAIDDEAKPGVYTLAFTDDTGQYRVSDPEGKLIGVGQPDKAFAARGVSFVISDVTAKPGSTAQILIQPVTAVADVLRRGVTVTTGGTNIISLKMRANEPQEAARLANGYAEAYVAFARQQKTERLKSLREFLTIQVKTLREDLGSSGQLLIESGLKRHDAGSILGLLQRQGSDKDAGSREGGIESELARQLFGLETRRATLLHTLRPEHRLVAELDRQITDVRNRLIKQFQQTKKDWGLLDVIRESQVQGAVYAYMLQKLHETRIAEASEVGSARIIDRALPPGVSIGSDFSGSVKFGGLLGLSLGIGLALLLSYLDRSVKDAKEIEDRLGLPVFGVIPRITDRTLPQGHELEVNRETAVGRAKVMFGSGEPGSLAGEAYRSLRTNVQFAGVSQRQFLFTSVGGGEGKSLTVANLAIIMSRMERRVLVVDADLRKPTQHFLFGATQQLGLTDFLAGKIPWQEVVKSTTVEHVDLIVCGKTPPNPTELLAQQAMTDLLQEAKQRYDMVLLDSPPVIPFADACVLAPLVGGVFLVVQSRVTTPEGIAQARSRLNAVNGKLIGTILNGVRDEDGFGYHYNYYYLHADENGGNLKKLTRRILRQGQRFFS